MEQDKDCILRFEPFNRPNREKWKRSIIIYILSQNITKDSQKQAIILHKGGQELQDIFFGIPTHGDPPEGTTAFQHTINLLDQHFIPKLRQQIAKCDFADADMEMCDQIIESDELRRKLLEKNELNLSEIIEEAKRFDMKTKSITKRKSLKPKIRRTIDVGMKIILKMILAAQQKIKNVADVYRYCKTKSPIITKEPCKKYPQQKSWNNKINAVNETNNDDDAVVFHITKKKSLVTNVVACEVGDAHIKFLIDSGSSCNIISEQTWRKNKINHIQKESEVVKKLTFFGYQFSEQGVKIDERKILKRSTNPSDFMSRHPLNQRQTGKQE
ncbi:hypothetical protein ACI65C_009090 [Semiaphis heraclei]